MSLRQAGHLITLEVSAPLIEKYLISGYQDENQIDDRLCWAACISSALVSIKAPFNQQLSQEQLACRFICTHMRQYDKDYCNSALRFDEVAPVWRNVGFNEVEVKELTNLDYGHLISSEIAEERPVQAYVDSIHAVMVYGYQKREDGEEEVLIMDPQNGAGPRWFTIDDGLQWDALWYALKHQGSDNA